MPVMTFVGQSGVPLSVGFQIANATAHPHTASPPSSGRAAAWNLAPRDPSSASLDVVAMAIRYDP